MLLQAVRPQNVLRQAVVLGHVNSQLPVAALRQIAQRVLLSTAARQDLGKQTAPRLELVRTCLCRVLWQSHVLQLHQLCVLSGV